MNRNPNSGRGGGHHHNSGGGGGQNSRGGGHNNHNHNNNYNNNPRSREFHSRNATPRHSPSPQQHDMKLVYKPHHVMQLQVWRSLLKRYENLQEQRVKTRQDYEKHRYELEKTAQTKFQELLESQKDILREKVEQRDAMRKMEVEVKAEREAVKEESSGDEDAVKKLEEREEELQQQKESVLDSLTCMEDLFSAREKKFMQEFSDERDRLENERRGLLEKCTQQERKLDFEVQRFAHDMDFQWIELERRMRFNHPMAFEHELMKSKHEIQFLNECVEELETRHTVQQEQMQQLSNECAFEKARIFHDFETAKGALCAHAKHEGVIQFIQGDYSIPESEVSFYSVHNVNGDTPQFVAQLQASLMGEKKIPPPPEQNSESSQYLIDMRDRYEELKAYAWKTQNQEKFSWSLSMIRKIVSHYESQDMRVYEHVTPSQYVSRLVWCPNELLYPDVPKGSFAMGLGETKEEATENAVQWAYSYLQKERSSTSCSSESRDSGLSSSAVDEQINHDFPISVFRDVMTQSSQIDPESPVLNSKTSTVLVSETKEEVPTTTQSDQSTSRSSSSECNSSSKKLDTAFTSQTSVSQEKTEPSPQRKPQEKTRKKHP